MKATKKSGSAFALVLALTLAQGARGATWQGGTADWASDHWGLNSPDGYPGDIAHPSEFAGLTVAGEAQIKPGDSIDYSGVAFASVATVEQTGGTMISDNRFDVRTRIDLLGGTLTGNGVFWVSAGGIWNVDGGELGTRVTTHDGLPTGGGAADAYFDFVGTGDGTLLVTESGIVDIHTIDMNDLTGGGDALVEVHGVVPAASDGYKRSTLYWQLNKHSLGGSATAKFVLSSAGITPWRLISNNSLNLGTGANRGLLDVDVSAFSTIPGLTTNVTLFDYTGSIQGDGTFGGITIVHQGEVLDPGPEGNLGIGQYYLDMTGGPGNTDIVLYFNIPEPSTVVLLTLGGLLAWRKRK